jgi:hypothetical protein
VKGNPIPLCRGKAGTGPAEFYGGSVQGRVQRVIPDRTLFDQAPENGPVIVRILKESEPTIEDLPVWRAHFWDCPHSRQWRKAKVR